MGFENKKLRRHCAGNSRAHQATLLVQHVIALSELNFLRGKDGLRTHLSSLFRKQRAWIMINSHAEFLLEIVSKPIREREQSGAWYEQDRVLNFGPTILSLSCNSLNVVLCAVLPLLPPPSRHE